MSVDKMRQAEKNEDFDSFICPICSLIVYDGRDCKDCDETFCKKCIDPLLNLKKTCPKNCKGEAKFAERPINRRRKQMLMNLNINCNKCGETYSYE